MSNNKLLFYINIANYLIIRFLLLKSLGINTTKFFENMYSNKNILNLKFIKNLIEYRIKGINNIYLIRYLTSLTNMAQFKLILDEYLLKNKIDELHMINILERNRYIIKNIEEKINLYFIILTAILYPLPVVLIIASFFFGINPLVLMPIPVILAYIIHNKMKKDIINE